MNPESFPAVNNNLYCSSCSSYS